MNACAFALILTLAADPVHPRLPDAPPAWVPGPHLMLDETLVAKRDGLSRVIYRPSRWPDPIVTGYEDDCTQPWLTVVRDPQTRRFRLWYNIQPDHNKPDRFIAYMESEDGIHWIRPYRVLKTPPLQTGASVVDEGPSCVDPSRRFKLAWWKDGGLQVASSPDGMTWTALGDGVVLKINHDITAIDWDPIRGRYMGLLSRSMTEGPYRDLRIPHQSVSSDLIHWKEPLWEIVRPDPEAKIEKGQTQFYGMSAAIARGNLLVSMVKVLRDDLNCEPDKKASELHDAERRFAGIGYTVLAWSHDGEHWNRDTQPFLDRSSRPGTWDRAMAWVDDQIVVGDFTYLYYGGYRWGHKAERFTGREIGFAQIPRDRYAGFTAGDTRGHLITRTAALHASQLSLNAQVDVRTGELKVRILDENGKSFPGFDWEDCASIRGDRIDHAIHWKQNLGTLENKSVCFELQLRNATIYSFDLRN